MIPKTIHLVWYGNDTASSLPNVFKKIYDQNRKTNPNFEFKIWSDWAEHKQDDEILEGLIRKDFPNVIEVLNKTNFAVQKADIKRLAILYYYGGIYIDTDISLLKPIDTLIDFENDEYIYTALEPEEQTMKVFNKKNILCNAFMCSPRKHSIFKQALETVQEVYIEQGDVVFNVFNCFGADILTRAILKYGNDKCKLIKRSIIYPITDPKLEDLERSKSDILKLKLGTFGDAFMVHYWMHSNFESKKLINDFYWNDDVPIHHNIYIFFKQLYRENKHLKD